MRERPSDRAGEDPPRAGPGADLEIVGLGEGAALGAGALRIVGPMDRAGGGANDGRDGAALGLNDATGADLGVGAGVEILGAWRCGSLRGIGVEIRGLGAVTGANRKFGAGDRRLSKRVAGGCELGGGVRDNEPLRGGSTRAGLEGAVRTGDVTTVARRGSGARVARGVSRRSGAVTRGAFRVPDTAEPGRAEDGLDTAERGVSVRVTRVRGLAAAEVEARPSTAVADGRSLGRLVAERAETGDRDGPEAEVANDAVV